MPTPEYKKRYEKENRVTISLNLYKNTELEIIDYLRSLPNKNGYIKELIKKDMASQTNN